MRLSTPIGLLAILLLSHGATAQPVDVHPVRQGDWAVSLNGPWKFRYTAGPVATDVGFSATAFDDAAWAQIPVPSNWELEGFAAPKYGTTAEGAGDYRRHFTLPETWRGQRVYLHFDGALYGIEVWVNGHRVGSWASSYNPVAFEITEALQPGDNVVAVRDTIQVKGWDFDLNDCWGLSGIFRDVIVFAAPAAHLEHYTARTKLNEDGSATLTIAATTSGAATVTGRLTRPDGKVEREFSLETGGKSPASVALKIVQPVLWTAETPRLYPLELTITAAGQRSQVITEKIGLREVKVSGGMLLLNGVAIKLRGVDHHDLWPDSGRTTTEEKMRRDLVLIKGANCNFIRTSHYPPHPRFIELCDEMGIYVMDEVPFGYGDVHLTDPSYQEILLTRARATVRRDENRPSVIIWSVGNENPNTPLTFATGRRVKELDPTRPMCFPQIGSYFARSYRELPDWVDLYAPHYPSVATVKDYAENLTRPIIHTEYAHALGLAADRIQEEWAIMQASPRYAGGAVWMFQDQGIRRESVKSAEETGPNPYVWTDAHHYFDTNQLDGMDGIVYSDRNPQVDYWEVRKVYSPVQIAERETKVGRGDQTITLHVENRFDFRSLSGIKLDWTLEKNGRSMQTGTLPLAAQAHHSEALALPLTVPDQPGADAWWLALRCTDETGNVLHERSVKLDFPSSPARSDLLSAGLTNGKISLDEKPDAIRVHYTGGELSLDRQTGMIAVQDAAGRWLFGGFLPHAGRRFTEAEKLRAKKEPVWNGAFLPAVQPPKIEIHQEAETVALTVRGNYAQAEAPGQGFQGELRLLIKAKGEIEVTYDYVAIGRGSLLEAGLSLIAPAISSEFRWLGAGPYAGYPGKDLLNEFGLHHLNRDDLYFQGNRRGVELAALTEPDGRGFLVILNNPADLAVEKIAEGTLLSHNAVLSGRGNKGVGPETNVKVDEAMHIAGHFVVVSLSSNWPDSVQTWLGDPLARVKVFNPFYRSYDQ